jgi:hypothetical protein
MKKKIAAAKAQNKPEVAQLLRKAMTKLLLHRPKRGARTKKVGGTNLTGTRPVATLSDSSNHAHADRLTMQKRGIDGSEGTMNTTRKRAKCKTMKETHTAAYAQGWEEAHSQAGDFDPDNEDYDVTNEATEEGVDVVNDEWYWDQKFQTWVFTGSKKPRKRDLTNKVERNWVLGMRRNWDTVKQAKLLEKITITREQLSTVRTRSFTMKTFVPIVLT